MNSIGESVRILVSMLYKRDGEHRIFFHDLLQGPFRLFLGDVGGRSLKNHLRNSFEAEFRTDVAQSDGHLRVF